MVEEMEVVGMMVMVVVANPMMGVMLQARLIISAVVMQDWAEVVMDMEAAVVVVAVVGVMNHRRMFGKPFPVMMRCVDFWHWSRPVWLNNIGVNRSYGKHWFMLEITGYVRLM